MITFDKKGRKRKISATTTKTIRKPLKSNKLLLLFLLLGIILRFGTYYFAIKIPIYDQEGYVNMATKVMNGGWAISCCGWTYVYPLFIAIAMSIAHIFGITSLTFIRILQLFLDIGTGLMLASVAGRLSPHPPLKIITFALYMLNPWISMYTPMLLSEPLTLFLLTALLFIGVRQTEYTPSLVRWLLFGLLAGLLGFTRLRLLYWLIMVMVFTPVWMSWKEKRRIIPSLLFTLFGCIIPVLYPVLANYQNYHTLSPFPHIDEKYNDMYLSTQIARFPTLLGEVGELAPPPVFALIYNFDGFHNGVHDTYIKNLYKDAVAQTIGRDPVLYAVGRIRNIGFLWNKSTLRHYRDPLRWARWPNRIINWLFLLSGAVGLGIISLYKEKRYRFILLFSLSLIVYHSTALTLVTPEERLTIPTYALMCLLAAVPLSWAWHWLVKRSLEA